MVKRIFAEKDYAEVSPAYVRGGVQYYFLRVDPQPFKDGKVIAIEEVYDHEPTQADKDALYAAWLAMEKRVKVAEIVVYDITDAVNVFEINGMRAWLDKATRVGLQNSLRVEKEAGHETSTLYLNGVAFVLPIDEALGMLAELELYAVGCYQQTEAHKAAVNAYTSIEDVIAYDYTQGYPEHPVFNV